MVVTVSPSPIVSDRLTMLLETTDRDSLKLSVSERFFTVILALTVSVRERVSNRFFTVILALTV
ncbi:MAG: hypothetical protein ACRD5H_18540, partial [Nitrososphaerales archaeon]